MRALRNILLVPGLVSVLSVCTTTIVTRVVIQPLQDVNDTKQMIDAVTYVLTNNGFDVAFINEKYGLINSDWRPIESSADTAASVLSVVGSAMSRGPSSYNTYSRDMMISFQLFANEYRVIPKLKRKTNTTSFFGGSSRENVEYPTQDSNEGKLVRKIVSEINGVIGIPNNIRWEEKVVTVGEEPQ